MHLNEYQERAKSTDQQPLAGGMDPNSSEMLVPLLGMVGELGERTPSRIQEMAPRQPTKGQAYALFPDRAREELGDLLWYLSNTATKFGLSLEEVGRYNLQKTASVV